MTTTQRLPDLLWAQRNDTVYVTVDLQDVQKPKIELQNDEHGKHGSLIFKGRAKSHALGNEEHEYDYKLDLYGPIDPEKSKLSVTARQVVMIVAKGDSDHKSWPRLSKDKAKQANVKVDWDKWVDSDDEDGPGADPASQFDLSSLADFSNFNTTGDSDLPDLDKDDDDSDDDEMPELEKA